MAKADNKFADIQKLMQEADKLLKKKKEVEKRRCSVCKKNPSTHGKLCTLCFREDRKTKEALQLGKRWFSTDGYERIYVRKDGKIVPKLYHRYLVEQCLGRELGRNEKVSWKDNDCTNNSLDNLQLVSDLAINMVCPHCHNPLTNPSTSLMELPSNTTSPVVLSLTLSEIPDLRSDI